MNNPINTLSIAQELPLASIPTGTIVVMDHETCPFEFIVGTGTVVPLPDVPDFDHLAGRSVGVRWHDQDEHPGVSAPYDPAFLKPLIPYEAFMQRERADREERQHEIEAAANARQVRQMHEWLAKPIGYGVTPGDALHHVICAIQVIRNQAPAYSLNKLAREAGIPSSTLRDRLNGRGQLTVTNVFQIAQALGIAASDILQLAEKVTK